MRDCFSDLLQMPLCWQSSCCKLTIDVRAAPAPDKSRKYHYFLVPAVIDKEPLELFNASLLTPMPPLYAACACMIVLDKMFYFRVCFG